MELDVEGSCSDTAAVHRAKNLDLADRVEAEALRDAGLHQFDDPRHGGFGIVGLDEVEVAVALGSGEVGDQALVDPVRAGDDPTLGRLAKDLGQTHDRDGTGGDDVGEDLARAH